MQRFLIPQVNGVYEFQVGNNADVGLPYHKLMLEVTLDQPGARMKVETRPTEDADWVPVSEAASLTIVNTLDTMFCSVAKYYRFTITGIVGGSGHTIIVRIFDALSWLGAMPPVGLYEGLRAMTVQSYTEANVKNGVQYECSIYVGALAGGANIDLVFNTGSKPVIVKNRQVGFTGVGLEAIVYGGTTFTGGTTVPVYNLTALNPVATTVQVLLNPTILTTGTEGGARSHYIGTSSGAGNQVGTFVAPDTERVLAPFTTYMLRLTNLDSQAIKATVYLTWYEGTLDLPRLL